MEYLAAQLGPFATTSDLLTVLNYAPPLAPDAVVAVEVEYLAAQLWQLPIMQRALEESEASGHTCGGDHCTAPSCGAPTSHDGSDGDAHGEQQHAEHQELHADGGSGGGSAGHEALHAPAHLAAA